MNDELMTNFQISMTNGSKHALGKILLNDRTEFKKLPVQI